MSYQPPTNYNMGWPGDNQTPGYEQPNGNAAMPPSNYPPMPSAYPPPMGAYSPYTQVVALPQRDQRKGLALAGFILSLLSIVAFSGLFMGAQNTVEGLIWFSGVALAIIGIILSALGRRSVSRKGLAIAGLVLSILILVLLVGILLLGLTIMASHSSSY